LQNKEQCSYKVRDAADVQAAPPPPIDEYLSDSTMGSYDEAPAARRTPSKVTAQPRTWQTTSKISASRDAATIVVTQTVEAKKKWKQTRPTVLVDMATVSSGIETSRSMKRRATLSRQSQRWPCLREHLAGWHRWKNRRWRRPAGRQQLKSALGQALI
jgi:hypothetical protein